MSDNPIKSRPLSAEGRDNYDRIFRKPFSRGDYCHEHGGWGSDTTPCKVCGVLSKPNPLPSMPAGLSLEEATRWGAEEINRHLQRILP